MKKVQIELDEAGQHATVVIDGAPACRVRLAAGTTGAPGKFGRPHLVLEPPPEPPACGELNNVRGSVCVRAEDHKGDHRDSHGARWPRAGA